MISRYYIIETLTDRYDATHLFWDDAVLTFWGRDRLGRERVLSVPYHVLKSIEEVDRVVSPRRRKPHRPITGKRLLADEDLRYQSGAGDRHNDNQRHVLRSGRQSLSCADCGARRRRGAHSSFESRGSGRDLYRRRKGATDSGARAHYSSKAKS